MAEGVGIYAKTQELGGTHSFTVSVDGTEAPFKGDAGITTVSVKRIDANTFEETLKRDGKPITVNRMTVSADGKTLAFASQDLLMDRTTKFTAMKK